MSLFNDHRRCLEILDGDDEDKRRLVHENIKNIKMTFGKHKGKTFRDILVHDTKWVWWACNMASSQSATLKLFKRYCDSNKIDGKGIKPIMKIYIDKGYKLPEKEHFRRTEPREMYCRFCDFHTEIKESFSGDECSVCGLALR